MNRKAVAAYAVALLALGVWSHRDASDQAADVCQQANALKVEVNARVEPNKAVLKSLRGFLISARDARLASWERDHQIEDKQAVDKYNGLLTSLKTVHYGSVPLSSC